MVKRILVNGFLLLAGIAVLSCNNANDKRNDEASAGTKKEMDKYEKKKAEGVDFIATGDQPTWEMDIDLQKAIWFTTLEENTTALTTSVPKGIKSANGDTLTYEAAVDAGSIKVMIVHQPCINSTTGEVFDYNVEVQTSGKIFKGCGRYLN